ncbi:peptide chain release factor N(5)-glutamine methyltransferase [Chitinophaga sancti]|uniref:Release factor glutamine methyltransferase n=1 Tax=Chitinophaga sancti TaxID=1004 RepID=A0A1K1QLE7_9BACT|nr:peptide chain release factor N(5)-glutamine methyltransferase [Chitinophaga sancti]WQD65128.1 peptide chain release factor N(5)-glutamine methyltransferase [Chitinophaga sancti]WQG89248.1 peptide chain release factor N(5)-glutamine methyltransferase [Chitinophaga sancti]SFW60752.1 release factor glutamine methyltransferase [Chitinophaga sancti]
MTIQVAFIQIIQALSPIHGDREAASIAHILMEHITGLGKMDRIVYKDRELTEDQADRFQKGLDALLRNEPVQYVTGTGWFYGMELQVTPDVLIPRPETEELAEWIIEDVKKAGKQPGNQETGLEMQGRILDTGKRIVTGLHPSILDIGTGSGAIPLAIKKNLPSAAVSAIDISAGALEVAKANAKKLSLDVNFSLVDVLDVNATAALPIFDIIVSNPPYICEQERAGMQEQVLDYEPNIALFVPDHDPLRFYRRIGELAQEKLAPGGGLYFEINEAYGAETVKLLEEQGYVEVVLKQDLFGKDRMVKAKKL